MKLYDSFGIKGPEVRWISASAARGRPEGYWQETGFDITGTYEPDLHWMGSREGLHRAEIHKKDQDEKPVWSYCFQPIWYGEQLFELSKGKTIWEDRWIIEVPLVIEVETNSGYRNVRFEEFEAHWLGYLRRVGEGLYVLVSDLRGGMRLPLEGAEGCFPNEFECSWSGI